MTRRLQAVTDENFDDLSRQLSKASSITSGGGDGYNGGMEARIKSLEEAVKNLPTKADFAELRLSAQVDASILRTDFEKSRADTTKATGDIRAEFEKLRGDVAKGFGDIRADMHKNSVDIQRWMIATVIGLFLGFGGLFLAMSNALKQPAPSPQTTIQPASTQQPPIIINVPAAAAPTASPQQ